MDSPEREKKEIVVTLFLEAIEEFDPECLMALELDPWDGTFRVVYDGPGEPTEKDHAFIRRCVREARAKGVPVK